MAVKIGPTLEGKTTESTVSQLLGSTSADHAVISHQFRAEGIGLA
jgi:hypothetical protein